MIAIAIVIPYYKFSFFKETLESLAAQTDKRFHVYIGNDASPEDPEELLKEFEGQFQFTYKKFEENLGGTSLTQQWERCIEMIKGEEWLMILGDDDVLSPNAICSFYNNIKKIEEDKINVVRFNYQQIDGEGKITSPVYCTDFYLDPEKNLTDKFKNIIFTSLSQYVFRRSAYIKHGFVHFPLAWASDDLAVLQMTDGKPIYSIDEIVQVRISDQNISGNRTFQTEKSDALKKFFSVILNGKYLNKADNKNLIADLYFNELIKKINTNETIIFFSQIFPTISRNKFYYIKAYISALLKR